MAHQAPESPKLVPPETKTVQQVVDTFIYYARAVDPTMLLVLKSITTEQSNSTEANAKSVTHLLNYASTHSEDITIIQASGYDPQHPHQRLLYVRSRNKEKIGRISLTQHSISVSQ